jgi:hypothetical protein
VLETDGRCREACDARLKQYSDVILRRLKVEGEDWGEFESLGRKVCSITWNKMRLLSFSLALASYSPPGKRVTRGDRSMCASMQFTLAAFASPLCESPYFRAHISVIALFSLFISESGAHNQASDSEFSCASERRCKKEGQESPEP